jgi:murein DD-endopeptidase MepM/ murein hydrolase activator NlpD
MPVDTSSRAVLQPAQQPFRATRPHNTHKRVDHRSQFSLLVVRGDGARVLRLTLPRRFSAALLGALVLGLSALGGLLGDWWEVRQRLAASAHLFRQLDEQQATIDTFKLRVTELRREVHGWRDLHARIWEPFGPELAPRGRDSGIGGRATPEAPSPRRSPLDELEAFSEQVMEEGQSLRALDRLIGKARRALVLLPSRWPVRGGVNSEYGKRASPWTKAEEFHSGIDIGARPGTPVRAPAPGAVYFAGSHPDFGLTVIIDHSDGVRTIYGHLAKILVRHRAPVERGATIGLVGNTGRSSGPHLHYEVLVKGQPVNPRAYLWD